MKRHCAASFDNLVRAYDQLGWKSRAESFSRLEIDASSYLVGRRLDQKVGGFLAPEDAMLDPPCRFPAIFEKLGVALMARSFRL
jgi:hypothetical protein